MSKQSPRKGALSFWYLVNILIKYSSMPSTIPRSRRAGFTLIELMLVIGIMGVLASVVVAALSPTRQLASSRNAKRQSDVNTIMNAVYQYTIDHQGNLPPGISATAREICPFSAASCPAGVNLRILSGTYLPTMPADPQVNTAGTGTLYFIRQDSNRRLVVSAPHAENDTVITITR